MMNHETEIISMNTGEIFTGEIVGEHELKNLAYICEMVDERWMIEEAQKYYEVAGIEKVNGVTWIYVLNGEEC